MIKFEHVLINYMSSKKTKLVVTTLKKRKTYEVEKDWESRREREGMRESMRGREGNGERQFLIMYWNYVMYSKQYAEKFKHRIFGSKLSIVPFKWFQWVVFIIMKLLCFSKRICYCKQKKSNKYYSPHCQLFAHISTVFAYTFI